MIREHVSFAGSQGATLVGRLEVPGDRPACALVAHCFTCSKDLRATGRLCHELTARGIGVLRFDFTGIGESGGEFSATSFSSDVEDIVAAAGYLRQRGLVPSILVGHSLGGAAVLAAAHRIPDAVAVATIAAPGDTASLQRKSTARLPAGAGEANGDAAELDLGGGRPVRIRRQLLDGLAGDHLHGLVAQLGRPLLIFHSPVDRVVGIEHAERLFLAARHPKSFVSLGTADHLLTDPRDAAQVGAVLAGWSERYLPAAELAATGQAPSGPRAAADPTAAGPQATAGQIAAGMQPAPGQAAPVAADALAAGDVEVVGEPGTLQQQILTGGHRMVADEPVAQGGTDRGPTPYGFLLAALGACTAMTLRLYANHKKIPLARVRVLLRHRRQYARDCAECESATAGGAQIERIERDLELAGPLTEQQRIRLHEIADRCPVHRTLTSHVDIVTRLL